MKKQIITIVAFTLSLVACHKSLPTPEEAITSYLAEDAALDEYFHSADVDYDKADSLLNAFVNSSMELARQYPQTEVPVVVLEKVIWYFNLEQKEELFSLIDIDNLNENNRRSYDAFLAEKNTAVGLSFTDFSGLTPDGDSLYLHELVGQKPYLLIDFWATWCGPCRRSMPAWKALYTELGEQFNILGVSLDRDPIAWKNFIAAPETALPWFHLSDMTNNTPANLYGVMSIPSTVLIDADGVIVARNIEADELREILKK